MHPTPALGQLIWNLFFFRVADDFAIISRRPGWRVIRQDAGTGSNQCGEQKAREAVRARLMGGDFMRAVAVNFVGMLAVRV